MTDKREQAADHMRILRKMVALENELAAARAERDGIKNKLHSLSLHSAEMESNAAKARNSLAQKDVEIQALRGALQNCGDNLEFLGMDYTHKTLQEICALASKPADSTEVNK